MRRLILLSSLIFLAFSSVYAQFQVKSSYPANGASGIPSAPYSIPVSFVFSEPIAFGKFHTKPPLPPFFFI